MEKKIAGRIVLFLMLCILWGNRLFPVTAAAEGNAPQWNPDGDIISVDVDAESGDDITRTLQAALYKAGDNKEHSYEITIPKGIYTVSNSLHIFSNTKLNAEGVEIHFTAKEGNILVTGTSTLNHGEMPGYSGYKNIYINKGTWVANPTNGSSVMRFFHGQNITLNQITVEKCGGKHQVEVCALDGFYVYGCTFKNYTQLNASSSSGKYEALQMDIPCHNDVYKGVYEDGTMMRNAYVENCTFDNVPRGVGSHTQLVGSYHENIYIRNNTFKNIAEEAIIALNYYQCVIDNNTITDCGGGILVQNMKKRPSSVYSFVTDDTYKNQNNFKKNMEIKITNNKITTKYTTACDEIQGIKLYGRNLTKAEKGAKGKLIPAKDYYIGGVTVTGNKITTAGHGIHLMDAKNCTIQGNTIEGKNFSSKDQRGKDKKYDGIFLEDCSTSNKISNNVISKVLRNGIYVYESSSVSDLSNNTISNSGKYGIGIEDSKSTSNFTKNKVSKSKSSGVFISVSSTVKSIKRNTITDSGLLGLGLWKNVKVTGAIEKNIIKNSKDKGISLSTNCSAKSITGNTISKAGKYGIFIYNKSKGGTIKSNKISGVKVKTKIKK